MGERGCPPRGRQATRRYRRSRPTLTPVLHAVGVDRPRAAMELMVLVRLVLGLLMTVVAIAVAGRRLLFLFRLIRSGQPAPGRLDGIGERAKAQLVEVFGQRKLLQWSIPGAAHFFTFWAFIVLAATILEAYGALFNRDFAIPVIGHWRLLGFLEDFFATTVLVALATFSVIRLRHAPERQQRASRFYGSHTRAAWLVLFMIFNVVWTLFLYRGAQINTGHFPFQDDGWWPFASRATAHLLEPLGEDANDRAGDDRHPPPDRRGARLPGARRLLQAPAHLPRPGQRADQARAQRARPAAADDGGRQADRLREHRRPRRGHGLRSRQGRGLHLERACSTSRPARSVAAARTSARPGTPASRCRPSW